MAQYLSLEEAAQKLGIPTDRLVELRSQGRVRGFRDGASWKFPEDAIEQLADDPDLQLADDSFGSDILGGAPSEDAAGGSGVLVSESEVGATSGGSSVIGAGSAGGEEEGSGSDLELGEESLQPSGSDVNLIAAEGEGSDVAIVASDSDLMLESAGSGLLEMESGELNLRESELSRDSAQLDLAVEPNAGSTGPVTDQELKEIAESHPDVLSPEAGQSSGEGSSSALDLGGEPDDISINTESDLSFSGPATEEDSGEELIGADDESDMAMLGSDIQKGGDDAGSAPASSLEMMGDLDQADDADALGGRGADVLSELDLLSAEQQGSGLITGDSENLLGSSGLGSSIGADGLQDSDLGGLDDALADDDELVIADDDDDLVISSAGSDISVAGDSGINLMSPSDSGLSLESEPLDLAGSSISALDLGAELSDGGSSGSGVGSGSDGSMVDFQADEEFQLSPSGVGLDADIESGSQVIEVEDSEAIAEPVEFAEEAFTEAEPVGGDVFAAEPEGGVFDVGEEEGDAIAIDESTAASVAPAAMGGYEVPFTLLQCVTLMMIICILSLGGMLMTDLVRNMWAYSEPSAPVSSLTDSLIAVMGWDK
jgi:excisionase family DNA binding protein